jgi:uncharacterized phiE125 gp8 family phage protein
MTSESAAYGASSRIELVTAPTAALVTLDRFKQHARITTDADDDLAEVYVAAATAYVEDYLARSLRAQTWRVWLDCWPGSLVRLPRGPVAAISSVTTYDADNVSAVCSTAVYRLENAMEPAMLVLVDGQSWPEDLRERGGIAIEYTTGTAAVPAPISQAVLFLAAHLYEQREPMATGATIVPRFLPFTFEALLSPYRYSVGVA